MSSWYVHSIGSLQARARAGADLESDIVAFCDQATQKTRALAEQPDQRMLPQLRDLEKKMGLVLTLVSVSLHEESLS